MSASENEPAKKLSLSGFNLSLADFAKGLV
jgi:hypothetical protein